VISIEAQFCRDDDNIYTVGEGGGFWFQYSFRILSNLVVFADSVAFY